MVIVGVPHQSLLEVHGDAFGEKLPFEKDFLPILNAVPGNPKLDVLRESFAAVVEGLDQRG